MTSSMEQQRHRDLAENPFKSDHLSPDLQARLLIIGANWQAMYHQIQSDVEIVPPNIQKVTQSFKQLMIFFIDGVNIMRDSKIDEKSDIAEKFSTQMAGAFLKIRAIIKNHPARQEVDKLLKAELGHDVVTANDILQTFKSETTLPFGKETLRAQQNRQRAPFLNLRKENATTGTTTQTQQAVRNTMRPQANQAPRPEPQKTEEVPAAKPAGSKLKKAALWIGVAAGLGLASVSVCKSTHTDTTEGQGPQTQVPEPNEVKSPLTSTQQQETNTKKANVKLHIGVDRSSEGYQKFNKYFARQGMHAFNEAMANAARKTKIEVSAETDKELIPFITYRNTLENCKKGARGFFLEYCNIRLQQLDKEIERLKKEGKKVSVENMFNGDGQFNDKLALNGFSGYAELPDPSTLAGYTVETDMKKNPALQRFHNRFAGPSGAPAYYQVVHTALQRIEQKPCTTPEITECVFERAFEVAAEESAKAKKHGVTHGAASIIQIEQNNYKNGQTSRINDIAQTYNVIQKETREPKPPVAEPNNSMEFIPATNPQPIHTKNEIPLWENHEQNFFADGESLSIENTAQQAKNDQMVSENPEFFYYPDQTPKKKGFFAKAAAKVASTVTDTTKKIFAKKEQTPEQKEMAELRRSIPRKSLFKSLFG